MFNTDFQHLLVILERVYMSKWEDLIRHDIQEGEE